jgi:hypothetical protein
MRLQGDPGVGTQSARERGLAIGMLSTVCKLVLARVPRGCPYYYSAMIKLLSVEEFATTQIEGSFLVHLIALNDFFQRLLILI